MGGQSSEEDWNGIVTASDISKAIQASHTKDVVVTECKDGPTWTAEHARMDVWVMARSWSRPRITGYEIKVSKSDFRNDKKWPHYLPLCNEFYFVCPKGLITPEELPAEAGLIYCLGQRLREVKKAAWRDIEIPESLCRYLLICRTRIVPPHYYDAPDKLEVWREWLKKRKDGAELGYQVSRGVRDYMSKMEVECERLRAENRNFADIRELAKKLDIPVHGVWNLEQRMKAAKQIIPEKFCQKLEELKAAICQMQFQIEQCNGSKP